MSLIDDLANAGKSGKQCAAALLLKELPDTERAAVTSALGSKKVHGTTIAGILRKHGHPISDDALQLHRRGACPCPTS